MIGQCGLNPDINKCQYFIEDKTACGADTPGCGFFKPVEKKKEIIIKKEPKWFEQYYK